MPSPGVPAPPRSSLEDSYLELLTDTLETLDLPARGQFLQRYLRAVTHLDLRESQCLQLWEEIITRRRQLSEALHRTVSLKDRAYGCILHRRPASRSGAHRI